ncbi:MAG: hypothetical protein J6X84_07695 [Treponema sp.]|nr:hypothetical protein [Treponema sp.]
MKSLKCSKSIYILITFGILFVLFSAVVAILNPIAKPVNILNLLFIISQAAIGLAIIILSKKVTKQFSHTFLGFLYLIWSVLFLFTELVLPYTFKQIWPLFGVSAGLLWFIAGRIKYGRLKYGFVIPSVTLFGMGIWYSFFSFKIIKLSFRSVVSILGPLFMVAIAVFLVVFFLIQQRHTELIVSDEETGVFSDEESMLCFEDDED